MSCFRLWAGERREHAVVGQVDRMSGHVAKAILRIFAAAVPSEGVASAAGGGPPAYVDDRAAPPAYDGPPAYEEPAGAAGGPS